MSWVSANIFRENINDKIAAFYALDKLASDDYTVPIALGSGATVAGLGFNPLQTLLEHRSDPSRLYPEVYKELQELTDAPLGLMERERIPEAQMDDLLGGLTKTKPFETARRKQMKLMNEALDYGEAQMKVLEGKAAKTPAGRILRRLKKIPGYGLASLIAPVVGIGGAIYTGRQLYNRYQDQKPWYEKLID